MAMYLPNKECPLCVCVCVCVPLQSNVIAQEASSRQELGALGESSVT